MEAVSLRGELFVGLEARQKPENILIDGVGHIRLTAFGQIIFIIAEIAAGQNMSISDLMAMTEIYSWKYTGL